MATQSLINLASFVCIERALLARVAGSQLRQVACLISKLAKAGRL